jgi:hypothetical protein
MTTEISSGRIDITLLVLPYTLNTFLFCLHEKEK